MRIYSREELPYLSFLMTLYHIRTYKLDLVHYKLEVSLNIYEKVQLYNTILLKFNL